MITTALHFSGGKDSLTILHLFRKELDNILVAWVNTGASYPDTVEFMGMLAKNVPHFLEVCSNQPEQIAQNGYPSDIVPLGSTFVGRTCIKGDNPYRIQGTFNCCAANIWLPMQNAMKEYGITKIIRGQRRTEHYTGPITNGTIEDGIEYILPIEDWTEAQVFEYLRTNNVPIPPYYSMGEISSRDCWNCTGYLDLAAGRISNLSLSQRTEVIRRLIEIDAAIELEIGPLKNILKDESPWIKGDDSVEIQKLAG